MSFFWDTVYIDAFGLCCSVWEHDTLQSFTLNDSVSIDWQCLMKIWITSVTITCVLILVTRVMTAQAMSFRYELACKWFSVEKAHHLVTLQNDLWCFIDLTFTLSLKLSFLQLSILSFRKCYRTIILLVPHSMVGATILTQSIVPIFIFIVLLFFNWLESWPLEQLQLYEFCCDW